MFFRRQDRREEFEAVALPHLSDLYRTAAYLVHDRTEAQDLVQDAYMHAWKAFDRFQPGTNCRAWLLTILFNEIRHHRRRWFNAKTVPEGEYTFEQTLVYEPPVADEIRDEEILAALESLSIEFREVVLLADVSEFAYKEVAEMLGIPVGTVMSRLSRARRQLRMKLMGVAAARGIQEARSEVV